MKNEREKFEIEKRRYGLPLLFIKYLVGANINFMRVYEIRNYHRWNERKKKMAGGKKIWLARNQTAI